VPKGWRFPRSYDELVDAAVGARVWLPLENVFCTELWAGHAAKRDLTYIVPSDQPAPAAGRADGATPRTDAAAEKVWNENPDFHGFTLVSDDFARQLERELADASADNAALREEMALKLAACDCAAMMDLPESHESNKVVVRGNPAWSPAFESVMRRTAECIALRAQLATAQAKIAALETQLEAHAWKISPAMAQAQIDQLNAKVAELEHDKARMDWLGQRYVAAHRDRHFEGRTADFGWSQERSTVSLRAAIDAARKEGQP
jgi:hypothetical protein